MQPSNFTKHPFNSVTSNSESETIARNIMVILQRTGNHWRRLSWEEYSTERLKDGNFTQSEYRLFDKVINYCISEETACLFCSNWAE